MMFGGLLILGLPPCHRGEVFKKLTKLYPTHACAEFNRVFPLLVGMCMCVWGL